MQQILDVEKYEQLQRIFVRELVEQIRFKLAKAGVSGEELHDLTLEIAFSVASTIDDQAIIEQEGTRVHPFLAFIGDEYEIIHCGENSYAHELVSDVVKAVFNR
ncbi:MAG: hypothetical protein ABW090_12550 [Sedimenticola sp.]